MNFAGTKKKTQITWQTNMTCWCDSSLARDGARILIRGCQRQRVIWLKKENNFNYHFIFHSLDIVDNIFHLYVRNILFLLIKDIFISSNNLCGLNINCKDYILLFTLIGLIILWSTWSVEIPRIKSVYITV
jgi:hypothetical protein